VRPYVSAPQLSSSTGAGQGDEQGSVPDLLGHPEHQSGVWGMWLRLTTPGTHGGLLSRREREHLRRSRLLSTLQLTAVVLMAILVPRGFLPVLDPGTLLGLAAFALVVAVSILLNRRGQVMPGAALFTVGLAAAIAGSQLATPSGTISFQDLAGYDLLVIPLVVAGMLLPSRVSVLLWIGMALFVVLDLGLAPHGANLDAYLPADLPPMVRIYPVAIYPVVLTAVVAVISWLSARSVTHALEEADRTAELERAYALLAEQKRALEEAIGAIQQVHARVANGDLSARAPTRSGDPLLQLAVSLNLTLDRLARSTLSAANLEAVEREVGMLSQYVGELAQANLRQPAPVHQMRRLAPLANSLEQLRTGIVQAITYTRETVDYIGAGLGAAGTQLNLLTPMAPADPDRLRQMRRGMEAAQAETSRLQGYLSRFV
jgi:hypothetical protein